MTMVSAGGEAATSMAFLRGGGDMGAMVRARDWSASPLGRPQDWPDGLRAAMRNMFNAAHPMCILWGPQALCLYNDGFRSLLGPELHPASLGAQAAELWDESWPTLAPHVARTMHGEGPSWHPDQRFSLTRDGRRADAYWTYSCSPIDDACAADAIAGVLIICSETTTQVAAAHKILGERDTLAQLFELAPTFMVLMQGPEHRFDIANPGYLRLVGHRPLLGLTLAQAMPEAVEQGFLELLDGVYASGKAYVASAARFLAQPTAGGAVTERYVDFVYQPIFDAQGAVSGIFVEGSDVTSQINAQLELVQVNEQLAEKIRLLGEADYLQGFQLALADKLRMLEVADDIVAAACDLLAAELDVSRVLFAEVDDAGQTVRLRHEWIAEGAPSVAGAIRRIEQFGPELACLLHGGVTIVNGNVALDARSAQNLPACQALGVEAEIVVPLHRGGRLAFVVAFHSVKAHCWSALQVHLAKEMAERTWLAIDVARAHAERRAERDTSRSIFDNMAEGYTLLDCDWTFLQMNDMGVRMSQRPLEQIIGHNHWAVMTETVGTDLEVIYRRAMRTREPAVLEHYHRPPSGINAWIEIRVTPISEGRLAIFFRDITERKGIEAQLNESNRRKDEFLAMLAHELRNPLAPISAAADLLALGHGDAALVRRTSEVISRQARHMTSLVDDLLDVSRVTQGLVTLDKVCLDVKTVVADAVEQVRPLMESRRHHFGIELSAEAAYVMGDKKRLVQVLTNLLNNAAKYTPVDGRIRLTMDVSAHEVTIHVNDNGIGMSSELTSRAFELFAQAERTPDRAQGGLGLGLALVKSLCELHEGRVSVASAGINAGSEFAVFLPRYVPALAAASELVHAALRQPVTNRVLIVDDNVDAATMLSMYLEATGHEVFVEHDALRALERARIERPDVCLLDIGLPGTDGNELARMLRQQPETQHCLLIAVTGYGQALDRQRTEAAGFDHHMVKPIDVTELAPLLVQRRA